MKRRSERGEVNVMARESVSTLMKLYSTRPDEERGRSSLSLQDPSESLAAAAKIGERRWAGREEGADCEL